MNIAIIGNNYFGPILTKQLSEYDTVNSYIFYDTNSKIIDKIKFILNIFKIDVVYSLSAFYCTSNAISKEELFKDIYISADIVVGDNVFIGSHTVVLPGSIIENNVVVSANSVVKGTLKSGYLYGGTPVVQLRKIS